MKILLVALACPAVASAQAFTVTFDDGANQGDWKVWEESHNSIEPTGGNPGPYLRLDNLSGPGGCHWLQIEPDTWPSPFSGDFRAQGVVSVGLDVDVTAGAFGGVWEIVIGSDPDTPWHVGDDCALLWRTTQIPPGAPGWTSYDFDLPAVSTTVPPGWVGVGWCANLEPNALWNLVVQDVDYVWFRMDTDPTRFCTFTLWDFGIDNIRIRTAALGTGYCLAAPNSAGSGATLAAHGSAVVTSNAVTFEADDLPPNQLGYFLMSRFQAQVPVAQGFLCLGPPILRFRGDVLETGSSGTVSFSPDLGDLPQAAVVVPGETWNFQLWYRDQNPSPTSNFSDGLAIGFE